MILYTDRGAIIGGSPAALIGPQDSSAQPLTAWAERHVRHDPDLRWVLGNYVEADEPNDNGHIFPLPELVKAQHTLAGKPLNMLHREHYIVGAFAGAQLLADNGAAIDVDDEQSLAAAKASPPHVEALAGMWHHRFPEEYYNIKKAHAEGTLYFSMEAIPASVSCPSCAHEAAYAGLSSDTYCEHMQGATAPKRLHDPVFSGGAIIIPPVRPGWKRADVTAISKLVESELYEAVASETPHLGPKEWELMMAQLLEVARDFSGPTREKMAKEGMAMPDGSFPIKTRKDVQNAIRAIGRTSPSKRAAVKAHIKRRAKALDCMDLIPPDW